MEPRRSTPQLSTAVNPTGDTNAPAVVVVQPDPDGQSNMARQLTSLGERVIGASGIGGALALLRECPAKVVLMAEVAGNGDIRACVDAVHEAQPGVMVVVLAHSDEPTSGVRPVRFENLDYVHGPLETADLAALIKRAVARQGDL